MYYKYVTFCGHRDLPDRAAVEAWLRRTLPCLYAQGARRFYVGGYGAFDAAAAAAALALRAAHPGLGGRAFVDTAPLAEKQLAVEAGLGWIGRQSLLVTPQYGSYVVLGELILTEETDRYDAPFEGSRCGRCHNCIESCPTGAIVAPKVIDTGRCISCHTIEKEPTEGIGLDGWIFGCDACQSLCPWNRRAPQHRNAAFDAVFDPLAMDAATWLGMDEAAFEALCGRTPLTRSGLTRIRENALRNAAPEEPSER